LVLASGANYAVLVLPPSDRSMTPALLRQLAGFVQAGLTLVGAPPPASPSLQDYPRCDTEVRQLVKMMWGNCNGKSVTSHVDGKGKVYWGKTPAEVLSELNQPPDFKVQDRNASTPTFIHRQDGDRDIYFISNQRKVFVSVDCSFRCVDRVPEFWNPQDGTIAPAAVWRQEEGRTIVPLSLDPAGSVFVVFRSRAPAEHLVDVRHEQSGAGLNEAKPPEFRILRADYGVFADGAESWCDVTTNVQARVTSGTNAIPASNSLAGEDPAPMIAKELRVQYRLQGAEKTESVSEGGELNLPAGAEVIRARYGQFRPDQDMTVSLKDKLASLVNDGQLEVQIDNDLAGGDPAPNRLKEVRVDYAVNGNNARARVPEGEVLQLPPTANFEGGVPAYLLQADQDGRTWVSSREPGEFTCVWSSGRKSVMRCDSLPEPVELPGPWEIHFPPGWGAPESIRFAHLQSWTDSENAGVKYFSGTATYTHEFQLPPAGTNEEIWLDLGKVKNLAEVRLNGVDLGILWKPPFRVRLGSVARPGSNTLEVKVTNLWPNRLIGDEQLPADSEWAGKRLKAWPVWLLEGKPSPSGRFTFTTWRHWNRDSALLESGLLGPVRLEWAGVQAVR
jgi:hypothetical protein